MNGPLHGCLKYQIDLGYHFMIVAEAYLQFSTCLSIKFQLHWYQRVRPKYGQSALHFSSGRENKQALSGVHETLHAAGITLFVLTA